MYVVESWGMYQNVPGGLLMNMRRITVMLAVSAESQLAQVRGYFDALEDCAAAA